MHIRPYQPQDWSAVWAVLEPVFREGETYSLPRDISQDAAQRFWTEPSKVVFVAEDPATRQVIGTYFLRRNGEGPGSHVCNCGYVVAASARGRGLATQLCVHSQREALARGCLAMQFNFVVSTNEGAVRLWQALGFAIVGTLPRAFQHPTKGLVDAYVMYKWLEFPPSGGQESPAR